MPQLRQGRPVGDRGAALIEFALIMPLLVMLLLGIVEFAWLFSQNLDVRHGAREGARLTAVNFGGNTGAIVTETCDRMDVASGARVTLNRNTTGAQDAAVGAEAFVTVQAPARTLTGLMDWAIPSGLQLSSDIEIRLEQAATWAPNAPGGTPC